MKDPFPCAGPQQGPHEGTSPAQGPWDPAQHRDQQGTAVALGTLCVWGQPLGREQQTPEEVVFCGSSFLWRFSQEPRDAPNPILQSLSLFLSLYPSLSLLPCSPTSSDSQERQYHQHSSQVAPSNSPHMHGGTSPSSSPSLFPSRARQAVSGWAVLSSLFPAFLHPSPSQADLAGHCVKVQPGLNSHKFLQLLSPGLTSPGGMLG